MKGLGGIECRRFEGVMMKISSETNLMDRKSTKNCQNIPTETNSLAHPQSIHRILKNIPQIHINSNYKKHPQKNFQEIGTSRHQLDSKKYDRSFSFSKIQKICHLIWILKYIHWSHQVSHWACSSHIRRIHLYMCCTSLGGMIGWYNFSKCSVPVLNDLWNFV